MAATKIHHLQTVLGTGDAVMRYALRLALAFEAFSCWYDSFGILESISRKVPDVGRRGGGRRDRTDVWIQQGGELCI